MRKLAFLIGVLLVAAAPASAQSSYPSGEIFGGYSYLNLDTQGFGDRESVHGVGFSFNANLSSKVGLASDFSYHKKNFGGGNDFDAFTFVFGPRFFVRRQFGTVFAHVLVGGQRVSGGAGSETGLALAFGGGLDINAGDVIAIRVGQADYLASRFSGVWLNNFRYEAGIVIKLGNH
jgi:hypothetical protein